MFVKWQKWWRPKLIWHKSLPGPCAGPTNFRPSKDIQEWYPDCQDDVIVIQWECIGALNSWEAYAESLKTD